MSNPNPETTANGAAQHGSEAVSSWVARWAHLVPAGVTVLDLACGLGRHAVYFSKLNHPITAVDIAQAAIDNVAARLPASARLVVADIENAPWPLTGSTGAPLQFGAVVVTNYLWRPLLSTIVASLAPGGVLIYETFAHGNASVGKPSRPDFLLQPGELLRACATLRVVAYEDVFMEAPDRFVQRIVVVREPVQYTDSPPLPKALPLAHQKSDNSASIAAPRYPLAAP
jgi:SAM-dependent methyltransferase